MGLWFISSLAELRYSGFLLDDTQPKNNHTLSSRILKQHPTRLCLCMEEVFYVYSLNVVHIQSKLNNKRVSKMPRLKIG